LLVAPNSNRATAPAQLSRKFALIQLQANDYIAHRLSERSQAGRVPERWAFSIVSQSGCVAESRFSNRNAKRWIIETLSVERFPLIPKAASSRRTPKRLRRGIQPLHFRFHCDLEILH